jgi:hypothetical protein
VEIIFSEEKKIFLFLFFQNVFIAVIIETFAEIRVQFQQMWGSRGTPSDIEATKILQKAEDSTLKLVNIDEHKQKGVAPAICIKIVKSPIFTTSVMIVVLANTIFTATIRHTHNEEIDRRNRDLYHKIEVGNELKIDL